jgi:hypothetical protein
VTDFYVQIATAEGIVDDMMRSHFGWRTVAKVDDQAFAEAMAAIVGMGIWRRRQLHRPFSNR